jgi:hypothetical protein
MHNVEKQDAMKKAWWDCWLKVKVILESQDLPTKPDYMPSMCMLFWGALAKQLMRVSNVLLEVSYLSK